MLFKLLCLGVSLPQETGVEPYPSTTEKEGEKWLNIKPRILFRRRGSRVWTTPTRRAVSHPMGEEWLRGRGRWQLQAVSCVTKEGGERVG